MKTYHTRCRVTGAILTPSSIILTIDMPELVSADDLERDDIAGQTASENGVER